MFGPPMRNAVSDLPSSLLVRCRSSMSSRVVECWEGWIDCTMMFPHRLYQLCSSLELLPKYNIIIGRLVDAEEMQVADSISSPLVLAGNFLKFTPLVLAGNLSQIKFACSFWRETILKLSKLLFTIHHSFSSSSSQYQYQCQVAAPVTILSEVFVEVLTYES